MTVSPLHTPSFLTSTGSIQSLTSHIKLNCIETDWVFFVAPICLLWPSCLYHQIAGHCVGDRGCCYSPQDSWGDKDVRGDGTPHTPVSSHRRACPASVSCVPAASGGEDGCVIWLLQFYEDITVILFSYMCVCVYPGKGAISGSAQETAATPPTLDYWGEDGGGLREDEEGGGEGGDAAEDSCLTAEDSARQSAAGLHYMTSSSPIISL